MKNILEKYAYKGEQINEKEEKQVSKSQIEDSALKLVGDIKKFCQNARGVLDPKFLNMLMAAKKGLLSYGHLNEDFSIKKDTFDDMEDREIENISQKAKEVDAGIEIVDEADGDTSRFYVQAGFYVYVGDNDEQQAEEKANELLSLIDKNHDGSSPKVIYVDKTSRSESKTYTKEEFLKELNLKKKGYTITEELSKEDFLKNFIK